MFGLWSYSHFSIGFGLEVMVIFVYNELNSNPETKDFRILASSLKQEHFTCFSKEKRKVLGQCYALIPLIKWVNYMSQMDFLLFTKKKRSLQVLLSFKERLNSLVAMVVPQLLM